MNENKKYTALTFDDGPNTKVTPVVLDILEKYGVTASFFLIGSNITDESAAFAKRAHDMGCEINSHSLTHSDMTKMTAEEIKNEMRLTAEKIFNAVGEYPKFFRPPYISYNETMFANIDLPFICGYGVDDWDESVSVEKRIEGVINGARDGAIILLHDSDYNFATARAVDVIIPRLIEDGFEFVTVSKLFELMNVTPKKHENIIYTYLC